jgi:hypothetical protein
VRVIEGRIVGVLLLVLLAWTMRAKAYVWDQVYDCQFPTLREYILDSSPVGQEFVPDLDYLEVVQLWVHDADPRPGSDGVFRVRIHSGSITGPLIGTSYDVTIPDNRSRVATFLFDTVPLVPQSLYVIELIQAVGGQRWMVWSCEGGYPRGCNIMAGVRLTSLDLWFREGVQEASAVQPLSWGRIKSLYQ